MSDFIENISGDLQRQIEAFQPEIQLKDVGTVMEAGDGIARVSGLANVRAQELIQFENGIMGIAFNLEKHAVGVLVMGEYSGIEEGMQVFSTGRIASVPVGEGLVGRVVNALGEPLDGLVDVCACGHPHYELAAAPALYAVVLGGVGRVSLPWVLHLCSGFHVEAVG